MAISDSSYNELAKQVYNVEPSKAKSNGDLVIVAGKTVKDPITKRQYRVLLVQDNNNDAHKTNDNGMQAMAVAPIVKGDVDTSQVVIAYSGTNAADSRDIDTDWQLLIRGNQDDLVSGNLDGGNFVIAENQLRSAQKFYQQVKRKYPHSALTTTGHSLGAYLALIVAAEHKIPATTFNGPDPVRGMSAEAITWVKANSNMYNNFRINFDGIGNFGAYFGTDDLAISRNVDAMLLSANPLYYHDLEAYRFNQKGQIVDRDGKLIGTQYLVSRAYLNVLASKKSMSSYHKLKKHWQSTGKGLSSSEELFLDAAQGMILGSSMAKAAREGADEALDHKTVADAKLMEVWSAINFNAFHELPYYEVQALFASYGITYDRFVRDFQDYTQSKVSKMSALATDFENLNRDIQTVIDSKLETDQQLAGEFRAWQTEL
ncbi:hypothetical protein [Streptococcus equi]|uniref:Lipase n=1 Tax=Streptococcus equi subsp. zooepidemicus Sz4is TaxID=1381082 RepID=A0AAW3GL21_STRSZ|nr:lipase [Streptococcus equi subsp. zooepidemicus Sz4is]